MNYLLLVRIVERIADGHEELEPLANIQLTRVGIVIERLAFDKFHNEVGQAVFGCAAVEQPGNVWVIECSQDLAFRAKAPENEICIHAALNELDRHAHLELAIDAYSFINSAHAASSHLASNLIRSQ